MSSNDWNWTPTDEERRQRKQITRVKAVLCKALRALGIATVTIAYDGEGDSGQIDDIRGLDAKKRPVSLDKPFKFALHNAKEPTNYASLREAVDDFAWTVLEAYHGGFQDNDGGFGTITIDTGKGTVTIDHNYRITDIDNTVTEV